jgi:threonine synthase
MPYSYLSHLACSRCGETFDAGERHQLCPGCGSPLLARYDLGRLAGRLGPSDWAARPPTPYRYHELLPMGREEDIVSLGERITPVVPLPRLGAALGVPRLFLKDEGVLPTGSFKARGAAVGVAMARARGAEVLALPTNGNAGAAWAAYAARAGLPAVVVVPKDAPRLPAVEAAAVGARVFLVDGLIGDAGRLVAEAAAAYGWFDASTLKEPYRVEGKKTMGFEIAEAFDYDLPDVIVYPTGGGVGLIGMHKAFTELSALGLVERLPRFVAVQAAGCRPIVEAFHAGRDVSDPWPAAHTLAFGINVPKALGDFLVLAALRETKGTAVAVDDEEIRKAWRRLGASEGLFAAPEGAATLAAVAKLAAAGWLGPEERVLVINTGSGLKSHASVSASLTALAAGERLPPLAAD